MVRRIAACAALLALMITMSACCCTKGVVAPMATAAKPAAARPAVAAAAPAKSAPKKAAQKKPCTPGVDRTACYADESDRAMNRLRDDLPPGGNCDMGGDSDSRSRSGCDGCPKCSH